MPKKGLVTPSIDRPKLAQPPVDLVVYPQPLILTDSQFHLLLKAHQSGLSLDQMASFVGISRLDLEKYIAQHTTDGHWSRLMELRHLPLATALVNQADKVIGGDYAASMDLLRAKDPSFNPKQSPLIGMVFNNSLTAEEREKIDRLFPPEPEKFIDVTHQDDYGFRQEGVHADLERKESRKD